MSVPSPSLFIQNVNVKVKKDELRRALYGLFSLYGKVIDVVHTRDPQVRGTAFIVFSDLSSSTSAMRGLDGESFFGKQLKITYAKSKSHATVGLEEGPEAVYAIKAGLRTAAEKAAGGSRLTVSGAQKKLLDEAKKAKRGREDEEEEEDSEEEDGPEKKKDKKEMERDEDAMEEESDDEAPAPAPGPAAPAQGDLPNPILFIEGVPSDATADVLSTLFQQYPGLASLKLLPTPAGSPPNSGSGFVQYETAAQAGLAKEALDMFLLKEGAPLKVSWAKRA
ncbi:hypothetical protein P7C70_g2122, partial [Phenoliferia sp. Uapishka_3]